MPSSRSVDAKDRRHMWTAEQDAKLASAVAKVSAGSNEINWHRVADYLPRRTNKDCRKRWHYQVSRAIRKGQWTREEDQKLRDAVQKHGTKWYKVSGDVETRNGDQCWKRWNDKLDPSIDHSPWNGNEDTLLLDAVQSMGRSWSDIVSRYLPGRTALAAKNRFTLLSRRLENNQSIVKCGNSRGTSRSLSPSSSLSSSSSSPSPSPPTSSSTYSHEHEDDGLSILDLNMNPLPIENILSQTDTSEYMTCGMNEFTYEPGLMSYLTNPTTHPQQTAECVTYSTSTISTPAEFRFAQLGDPSRYNFENHLSSTGQLESEGVGHAALQDPYLQMDHGVNGFVLQMRCRAGRTETVPAGLAGVINELVMQGDVEDVSLFTL
ncbi:hypothetical protein GGR50DRAFT_587814 [Xylaria sp. CBS 124048]|nr:hypothetical protein GGR50DRAFT_587814 [Xylaria sp. CBS 124048]